jgi:hypothetical protein
MSKTSIIPVTVPRSPSSGHNAINPWIIRRFFEDSELRIDIFLTFTLFLTHLLSDGQVLISLTRSSLNFFKSFKKNIVLYNSRVIITMATKKNIRITGPPLSKKSSKDTKGKDK